jgi:hypothetical protein
MMFDWDGSITLARRVSAAKTPEFVKYSRYMVEFDTHSEVKISRWIHITTNLRIIVKIVSLFQEVVFARMNSGEFVQVSITFS